MLQDKAAAADVLLRCFGKSGDMTVVVTSSIASDAPEKRRKSRAEFKVWSALLGAWSEVFARMLAHDFVEHSTAELVIEDFSPAAVEAFLRFMYSGALENEKETLVEVFGLADKYIVPQLRVLCEKGLEKELTPENACELLQLADRIGAETARQRCLEAIFCEPQKALPGASGLAASLIEELLASPLLCVGDQQLLSILLGWGSSRAAAPEAVAALIQRHVQLAALSEDEYSKALSVAEDVGCAPTLEGLRRACRRGAHTADLFATLWSHYMREFPVPAADPHGRSDVRPPFLGFWVNLIPSLASFGKVEVAELSQSLYNHPVTYTVPRTFDHLGKLQRAAANQEAMSVAKDTEMVWMLPHHAVYLTGIGFEKRLGSGSRVEIFASQDGAAWNRILDSGVQKDANDADGAVISCRFRSVVRWVKLCVREDNYSNKLKVQGILQVM